MADASVVLYLYENVGLPVDKTKDQVPLYFYENVGNFGSPWSVSYVQFKLDQEAVPLYFYENVTT